MARSLGIQRAADLQVRKARPKARGPKEPLGLMLEAGHVRLALDSAVKAQPSIKMIQPMSVSAVERDPAGVDGDACG